MRFCYVTENLEVTAGASLYAHSTRSQTLFFLYSNVHYLLTLVLTVMCFGCHVYQADGEEHCRAVFSPDLFHLSERGKLFQQSHIRDLCRIIGYSGCKKI